MSPLSMRNPIRKCLSFTRRVISASSPRARQMCSKGFYLQNCLKSWLVVVPSCWAWMEKREALVSAVLHLFEHPDMAETLGKRGRAFAEARFDRDQLVEAFEARIAMLLDEKVVR